MTAKCYGVWEPPESRGPDINAAEQIVSLCRGDATRWPICYFGSFLAAEQM